MSHTMSFAPVSPPPYGNSCGDPTHRSGPSQAMAAASLQRLRDWFGGRLALTRAEAHGLLESAIESGHMAQHRAEFVAAIKALAAGAVSWGDMGYRLLPDD